jgi:hypothetical protein
VRLAVSPRQERTPVGAAASVFFDDAGGSIRAAGGTLRVTGQVAEDVVLAGGTLELAPEATVGRDLVLGGGSATDGPIVPVQQDRLRPWLSNRSGSSPVVAPAVTAR